MAETTTITVRIPVALKAKLDRLAEITKRSRSYLSAEALEVYTRSELEIVEGILEGLEDVKAGRVHSQQEMEKDLEQMFAEYPLKPVRRAKKAAIS